MEEKKGANKILLAIIIILVIIIISAVTIIIYRNVLNTKGEAHLVDTINEDLNNVKNSETTEQNAKVNLPLTMNNKNINLGIEASFVNWENEEEGLFNQNTVIKINGKVCDEIETTRMTISNVLNYEIPEIQIISDSSEEKEYILLLMHENTPSSNTTIIKIYDDEGNVVTEFDNL